MKFFVIIAVVSTIFTAGDSLKCYQCTKGQYSNQEIYRHLSECFDKIENPVCDAASYCVKMTINSDSENHTIIYECDVTAKVIPEGAEELICSTDFCNFKEKGLVPFHMTTSSTISSSKNDKMKNISKITSTLSPNTSFETTTIKNSASSAILKVSLFFLVIPLFFI